MRRVLQIMRWVTRGLSMAFSCDKWLEKEAQRQLGNRLQLRIAGVAQAF